MIPGNARVQLRPLFIRQCLCIRFKTFSQHIKQLKLLRCGKVLDPIL